MVFRQSGVSRRLVLNQSSSTPRTDAPPPRSQTPSSRRATTVENSACSRTGRGCAIRAVRQRCWSAPCNDDSGRRRFGGHKRIAFLIGPCSSLTHEWGRRYFRAKSQLGKGTYADPSLGMASRDCGNCAPRDVRLRGFAATARQTSRIGHSLLWKAGVAGLDEARRMRAKSGSSGWTRTSNPPVNSRMLCH